MRLAVPALRRVPRLVVLVASALVLTACQVRTELNLTVDDDGSGQVELAVGLDEEAASRRPELLDDLDLSDLTGTGWEVTGPAEEADGRTWIRARHEFGTPEELGALVDEVAGEHGPFRDFRLLREDAFAETRYELTGTVDFSAGAGGLADDPELAAALEAEPIELLEARLGGAIDEMLQVQVAARLPGTVSSNAPTQASNGAVWQPSVLEREAVELRATGTLGRGERLVWLGVGVAAGIALVVYLAVLLVRRRRRRRAVAKPAG